ncbi:hypothetical protein [Bordetella bronchialis]|uniref:Uncharacterized protein n=1 Tax=Bordetella bronchialis TaxID=463025 RepID=A0A193FY23_9BORD|nr:hypothetical protein [Bordetella bronchialis]ANN67434.1 hypothetical protein BAU06_15015 [Bordetella bronchialis]ANN72525.1 hypothetical protein BAU08_15260 [Bordetella bronchialis]
MSGFGLQGIAYVGGLPATRQNNGADTGAVDGAFDKIFRQAAGTGAASNAAASSPDAARRSLADPDQWAAAHGAPAGSPGAKSPAAQQLSEYLSMPLGKRMFYMMLASMGISQEQYESMSPDEQAKVAAQVAQRLKENAEAQKQAVPGKEEAASV